MKNSTFMQVLLCFAYPVRKHMQNLHKSIDYHIQSYCWLAFLLKFYGIGPVAPKCYMWLGFLLKSYGIEPVSSKAIFG